MAKKLIFIFLSLFLFKVYGQNNDLTTPPSPLPVKVKVSSYLWNIDNINTKDQVFSADLYFVFSWMDERLAHTEKKAKVFTEEAVTDKLKTTWWPEIDFVNSTTYDIRNKTLEIFPDGRVDYSIKIRGSFYTQMDFRKFPFDSQDLKISVQSFLWNNQIVEFVPNTKESGYKKNEHYEGLNLIGVDAVISSLELPFLEGTYSDYSAIIHIKRKPGFFLYQILVPLMVVFPITLCMFFLKVEDLETKLFLGQGAVLVFVAMRFMINSELPQIDYTTLADHIFFLAYFCTGLAIAIAVIDYILWKKKNRLAVTLNKAATWIPLFIFVFVYLFLLAINKVI